jgi:hypothetical protein
VDQLYTTFFFLRCDKDAAIKRQIEFGAMDLANLSRASKCVLSLVFYFNGFNKPLIRSEILAHNLVFVLRDFVVGLFD